MDYIERQHRIVCDLIGPVEELRRMQRMADPIANVTKTARDYVRAIQDFLGPVEELRGMQEMIDPFRTWTR